MRKVSERVEASDRFVDVGVTIVTVVADAAGRALIADKPKMRELRRVHRGGVIDTKATPPRLIPVSEVRSQSWSARADDDGKPGKRVWYVSEDQATALFHDNPLQLAQLCYGSEGAGKTRLLCMWHYLRWLDHIGQYREGGQTAPTLKRLGLVTAEFQKLFAPDWLRIVKRDDFEGLELCDGTRIRLVSTYRQSAHQGSPIQGFNWSWCGRDEMQDQVEVHEDIESRGRSARVRVLDDGTSVLEYRQLGTATAKDNSDWRELRDRLVASGVWIRRELSIFRAPFVDQSFLANKKKTLSPREFLRRYGDPKTGTVADLPPELAVYYGWLRSRNLIERPQIATDVTAAILRDYKSYCRPGDGFTLLCTHDPGAIYNTTEILRLLLFPIGRGVVMPTWAVVGELQTNQTTAREHAIELKKKLQAEFGVEWDATRQNPNPSGGKACIFVDPHGKGEADTDYQSVYMAFMGVGLDVFNPAPMSGRIRRAPRIEMVNRLLGGSMESELPRLVVCKDDQGRVVAPKLVEAFESLKKNPGDKNPEGSQRKDEHDKTHAPAALAYGLWPFEQEAFTAETVKRAIAEARRI